MRDHTGGGVAVRTAGDFEDPRYSYLVSRERRRECARFHAALLDLRRAGDDSLGLFVESAGENTLLTYLLPDIYYYLAALTGFTYLDHHYNEGGFGVVRAMIFTFLMLLISAVLTRARVRLQPLMGYKK